MIAAPGNPADIASGDARPLALNVPVVIGDDPYHSHKGSASGGSSAIGPNGLPQPVDAGAPPVIPAAPGPNMGAGALLTPDPGKATVD